MKITLKHFTDRFVKYIKGWVIPRMNPSMVRGGMNVMVELGLFGKLLEVPLPQLMGLTVLDAMAFAEVLGRDTGTIDLDRMDKAVQTYYGTETTFDVKGLHFNKEDAEAFIKTLREEPELKKEI